MVVSDGCYGHTAPRSRLVAKRHIDIEVNVIDRKLQKRSGRGDVQPLRRGYFAKSWRLHCSTNPCAK